MTSRREFVKQAALGVTAISVPSIAALAAPSPVSVPLAKNVQISLAQWSLHRALENKEIKAVDFARIAKKEYDISAIEYVNQFYSEMAHSEKFWLQMEQNAKNEGVRSLLIMVDNEGDLGNPNKAERKTAVENHYKWIHAAKILGCHSIRVNAFGDGDKASIRNNLIDGLGRLATYGAKENINVIIENHGLHTSDSKFMAGIIREVNNPYLGTLPDFGNWCLNAKWGSTQNNRCDDVYDRYEGVADFLPFAKGVSAKSYAFDADGNETIIDYRKMLRIVKDSGFKGYIGVEYEGENMPEPEGIRATKNLIQKVWKDLG
ncbi:MAG: TIM barrel protein [Pricia sp.]|nr:TIM barrel protein [Pricia sp.]